MDASDEGQTTLTSICWGLVILRTALIVCLGVTITVVHYSAGITLPLWHMAAGVTALALWNVWLYRGLRRGKTITIRVLFMQLLADVAVLTLLLYCAGGSANPFVSLYLFPLVVAAVTLPGRYALAMGLVTVVCYSGLLFWHVPLQIHQFRLHVIGMWCNFVLSAGLITIFVVRLATMLRTREQELAAERERTMRNEHIVALGTLAAGAAHELATPLSTMAVVTRELEAELEPKQAADVACLREQVAACKNTLERLRSYGADTALRDPDPMPADRVIQRIVEDWRLLRPGTSVAYSWQDSVSIPVIQRRDGFDQMLTNLINNAANASPDGIAVQSGLESNTLVVDILDRGEGVAADITALAVKTADADAVQARSGMGLILAKASIEQLDGRIQWLDRDGGGICTRVAVPLQSLGVV